jgi:hypothetical protein
MDKLAELKVREAEVGRAWERLLDLVNEVARARADQEEVQAFRLLQHEAIAVGQRRLEIMLEMAAIEGKQGCRSGAPRHREQG